MHDRLSFALLAFLLVLPATAIGQTCLLIYPLQLKKGAPDGPGLVIPVLLKEYLSLIKGVSPLSMPEKDGRTPNRPAGYVIRGNLARNKSGLQWEGLLLDSEGKERLRFKGDFNFPSTMNQLLLQFIEQASPILTGKPSEIKKILPFLNLTRSPEAYQAYAEGTIELERIGRGGSPEKAVKMFEQAIGEDYNYVPAYLGLAESAAAEGNRRRGQVELEKAKLLNPPLAKIREPRIKEILKGKWKETNCD